MDQPLSAASFKNPTQGITGWTGRAGLDPDPVDYTPMIDPQWYAAEQEALFRRGWLYLGRADDIVSPGDHFTRELEVVDASLLIVRDSVGAIRAFHNVCPHRGNRLVWKGAPRSEATGHCDMFVCKYHGLGFRADGSLAKRTALGNWLDGQETQLSLAEVACDTLNGFIFVNLDPEGPQCSLSEQLGPHFTRGLESYPFDQLSDRYRFSGEGRGNWKLFQNALTEHYHGFYLHQSLFPSGSDMEARDMPRVHEFVMEAEQGSSLLGGYDRPAPHFKFEKLANSTGLGPRYAMPDETSQIPHHMNSAPDGKWLNLSTLVFPNVQIQLLSPGWMITQQIWPTGVDSFRFETNIGFAPAQCFSDRLAQHTTLAFAHDGLLQDLSTVESCHLGIKAGAFDRFPLIDEEVLLRNFLTCVRRRVEEWRERSTKN